MEFLTIEQQSCYEKIKPWMQELFPGQLKIYSDMPVFEVSFGSTFAFVQVSPWHDDVTITSRAYVASGATMTPELQLFLLRENDTLRFGAFGVDESGDIIFQHAIIGSTCDKKELHESVVNVVTIADRYDDQIVASWGGKRGLDINAAQEISASQGTTTE